MKEPSKVRVTGALEPFVGGFIVELEQAGYRPAAAALQVRVLAHLSRWVDDSGVTSGELTAWRWSASGVSTLPGTRVCAGRGSR